MFRLLLCALIPAVASACSCATNGPPCESAWKASAVFAGTVVEITHETIRPDSRVAVHLERTRVVFEVSEPFIGMNGRGNRIEIRTGMGGGDCGYAFHRGEKYLVYAHMNEDGTLIASSCSRTAPVDEANADLEYLRGLPKAGPFGYVFGTAGNGEDRGGHYDAALGTFVQPGISGAVVTLTGPGKAARVTTGDDGAFRFDKLAPGKYDISVAKDGYSAKLSSPTLDVHAGGCAWAWELLVVDRRIAGKITGADGFPAANIEVQLMPTRPTPQMQLPFPIAETKTKSDGSYELRDVPAGEYYLGINLAHTPSKNMPYTRYFYPGVDDPSRAVAAIVKEGAATLTYNFPIPAPQHERRIEGFVYWPDGRPAEIANIMPEDPRWPWQTNVVVTNTDARGHFEISLFDGTSYRIHAITMARTTDAAFSAEPLLIESHSDVSKPLRLVLSRKGHSAAELVGKGLERWRAGLGL